MRGAIESCQSFQLLKRAHWRTEHNHKVINRKGNELQTLDLLMFNNVLRFATGLSFLSEFVTVTSRFP